MGNGRRQEKSSRKRRKALRKKGRGCGVNSRRTTGEAEATGDREPGNNHVEGQGDRESVT